MKVKWSVISAASNVKFLLKIRIMYFNVTLTFYDNLFSGIFFMQYYIIRIIAGGMISGNINSLYQQMQCDQLIDELLWVTKCTETGPMPYDTVLPNDVSQPR